MTPPPAEISPAGTDVPACPALFIAAPGSGHGKTLVTAAIARHCRNRGRKVRVFKTGPDFLDPMILEQASGVPALQLDLWMMGENHCRRLLHDAARDADLILIEGAMGLFDGKSSSADLAELFAIPVLLTLNAASMGETFGALAHGLATWRPQLPVAGVFANRVGSDTHRDIVKHSLPAALKLLGWLPRDEAMALPARHLGLVQAGEVEDLERRLARAAENLRDIDDLTAFVTPFAAPDLPPAPPLLQGRTIAIARDAAFSFIYRANLALLEEMGARPVFFSPLEDRELPPADALWLPGGYPELHLEKLGANRAMKAALRAFHIMEKPIYAECGGLLYLLERLTDKEGKTGEMAALLPGSAVMQKRFANLGIQALHTPFGEARGHTFHYSKLDTAMTPALTATPQRKTRKGEPVFRQGGITASYLHLYFPSNPLWTAHLFRPEISLEDLKNRQGELQNAY